MRRYKFYVRVRGFIVEVFISADCEADAVLIAEAQYGRENLSIWYEVDVPTMP